MTAPVIHAESLGKNAATVQSQAQEPDPSASTRIPELDGLRGIAIGLVLLRHLFFGVAETTPGTLAAYVQALGRLTWSGVDLFFVLSGFLIGGILIDNQSAVNYFKVFYTRRFFRIIPLYMLCVAATFVLISLVQVGAMPRLAFFLPDRQVPWISYLLFLQNFWMSVRNSGGPLSITWSLAVEEQFYFTLPLMVVLLPRKNLFKFVCAVILIAPVVRLVLFLIWPGHPWAGFALLPCRADSLMLGVLGAITMRNPHWKARLEASRIPMLLLLGILAVGMAILTEYYSDAFSFVMQSVGFTWIALFYLCLLLYVLTSEQSKITSTLRFRPLRWLGSIAYGVYLYHMFTTVLIFGLIYSTGPRVTNLRTFTVSVVVVIVTLAVAQVSWLYFEKPLMKLGHRTRYEIDTKLKPAFASSSEPQRSAI